MIREWVSRHRILLAVLVGLLLPVPGTWVPVAVVATRIVQDGGIGLGGHTGVGLSTWQGLLLFCAPFLAAYTVAAYLGLTAVARYAWGIDVPWLRFGSTTRMNKADVQQLVEAELARMPAAARSAVRSRLTEAQPERRTWSYGPGEFECWRVGADHTGEGMIVYLGSAGAFSDRWGCVATASGDLGADDRWFRSLYDAAIAAEWLTAPVGHEVE